MGVGFKQKAAQDFQVKEKKKDNKILANAARPDATGLSLQQPWDDLRMGFGWPR